MKLLIEVVLVEEILAMEEIPVLEYFLQATWEEFGKYVSINLMVLLILGLKALRVPLNHNGKQ